MAGWRWVHWYGVRLAALTLLTLGIQGGTAQPVAHHASSWLPGTDLVSSQSSFWSLLVRETPLTTSAVRPRFSLRATRRASLLPSQYLGPDVALAEPAGLRAPIDSVVRLAFSEPMDTMSIEQSFRVEPSVSGQLEWPDPKTLVFRPSAPLAYRTAYRVSVAGYAVSQKRFAAAASFSFTTLWPPPNVPFPFTLTFDDCGSADQIQAILTALADRDLHAIFFPTGRCRDQFPWLIPTLLAAGHRVCNHTYSHPDLSKLPASAIASEIQRGVSVQCNLFRPPFGAVDKSGRVYSVAASLGYKIQLWDVDTRDWAGTPTDVIVSMIRARGGVVLMHMHGIHTVEAIRAL